MITELVFVLECYTTKQSWIELYHAYYCKCSRVMLKVVFTLETNTFDKDRVQLFRKT